MGFLVRVLREEKGTDGGLIALVRQGVRGHEDKKQGRPQE
ncbi:hypothetical protein D187_008007 [Cystobacter fuscus DSM 2262]|uniref:Uncharacterized protein n=1 Tax=Cystobacter fuscus (strain ATCC 25194 / DSM 2262 / NBRC 100088 / M29) TaxID=1242864 RepID=S9NWV3_CYSF2|nr:hypothetical protein D187_008007 [Cystobacter fuscus DSM 2262]